MLPYHRKCSHHSIVCPGHILGIFLTPFPVLPFSNDQPILLTLPKNISQIFQLSTPLSSLNLLSFCHFRRPLQWPLNWPPWFYICNLVYCPHKIIFQKYRSGPISPLLKTVQWLPQVLTIARGLSVTWLPTLFPTPLPHLTSCCSLKLTNPQRFLSPCICCTPV